MLKKFLNYQLLLSGSLDWATSQKDSKKVFFSIFILFIFMFSLSAMFDGGGIIFYPIPYILYVTYSIINSQNKLFEIPPVSKMYTLINIYLFVFVTGLGIIIAGALIILFVELLLPISSAFNLSNVEGAILLSDSWRAILVTGCMTAIIFNVLLPIFFIRSNFLRKVLIILVTVFATIALLLFKNALFVETGKMNFVKSINIMPNYYEILLILACVSLVTIPISIIVSYRIYTRRWIAW